MSPVSESGGDVLSSPSHDKFRCVVAQSHAAWKSEASQSRRANMKRHQSSFLSASLRRVSRHACVDMSQLCRIIDALLQGKDSIDCWTLDLGRRDGNGGQDCNNID